MKEIKVLLWVVLLFIITYLPGNAQDTGIKEALALLKNSKSNSYAIAAPDGPARLLYHKQLEAIELLANLKAQVDPALLIPYLDYAVNENAAVMPVPNGLSEAELLLMTRKTWPCFSILLDNPASAAALESYSLASSNPMDYALNMYP